MSHEPARQSGIGPEFGDIMRLTDLEPMLSAMENPDMETIAAACAELRLRHIEQMRNKPVIAHDLRRVNSGTAALVTEDHRLTRASVRLVAAIVAATTVAVTTVAATTVATMTVATMTVAIVAATSRVKDVEDRIGERPDQVQDSSEPVQVSSQFGRAHGCTLTLPFEGGTSLSVIPSVGHPPGYAGFSGPARVCPLARAQWRRGHGPDLW